MRGAQIVGQRKVILATPDGAIVDNAIDMRAANLQGYWDSLFADPLPLASGEQPTWFTIAPLTVAQKQAAPAQAGGTLEERIAWFIRAGLVRHEGYAHRGDDGADRPAPQPDRKDRGRLGEMASEEWYASMRLPEEDRYVLYRMIGHISEAQHPLAKSSGKASGGAGKNETGTERAG